MERIKDSILKYPRITEATVITKTTAILIPVAVSTFLDTPLFIAGDMPIEYIDHIEVYRSSSSMEFGNEASMITIRLYTKKPQREEGDKIRATFDSKNSVSIDSYRASYQEDSSYFAYIHALNKNTPKTIYHGYNIKKDSKEIAGFLQYNKKKYSFELGAFSGKKDPFLGLGKFHHILDGHSKSKQCFFNFLYYPDQESIFSISYDTSVVKRYYFEDNSSFILSSVGNIHLLNARLTDSTLNISYKSEIQKNKNRLVYGGFFKKRSFSAKTVFDAQRFKFSNYCNLFSVYAENSYSFTDNIMAIFSLILVIQLKIVVTDMPATRKMKLVLSGYWTISCSLDMDGTSTIIQNRARLPDIILKATFSLALAWQARWTIHPRITY